MRKKEFQSLLRKYNKGECTPEEEAFINDWFKAMDTVRGTTTSKEQSALVKNRSWTRVRDYILQSKAHEKTSFIGSRLLTRPLNVAWSIAASIAIVIASAAYLLLTPVPDQMNSGNTALAVKNIVNSTGDVMPVRLADGTEVLLQPKSSIAYKERFDEFQRMVTLEGEAFFIVSRDSLRPFLVNTNDIITKVLGTSFNVSAFLNDESVTVEVKTGKVSVITRHALETSDTLSGEVILTPNQKVIYNKVKNEVSRGIVDKPQPILPKEVVQRMHFEEAPVNEILKALEKIYGIDLEFDEDILSSCILTTSIGEGTIYNRLDMICKAIDATYSLEEDHIVINGDGCN